MIERLRVVLVGLGVVGRSLCKILLEEDFRVNVVAVVDSKSSVVKEGGLDLKRVLERKERAGAVGEGKSMPPEEIISDSEYDALVELTPANPGSGEPGLSHIRRAISAGRHVVTASKMPLALHYSELTRRARARGLLLRYGACVGAGIPILEFGESCVAVESLNGIEGVLNATSNFILSRMEQSGGDFDGALRDARACGYAESEPSVDLDGLDAAAKLVILVNHLQRTEFALKDVKPLEGIRGASGHRISARRKNGRSFRSLAIFDTKLRVSLVELPSHDPLCVEGAWNAVRFSCADSGERVIAGPAAGGPSTARAVLRDLIAVRTARSTR